MELAVSPWTVNSEIYGIPNSAGGRFNYAMLQLVDQIPRSVWDLEGDLCPSSSTRLLPDFLAALSHVLSGGV